MRKGVVMNLECNKGFCPFFVGMSGDKIIISFRTKKEKWEYFKLYHPDFAGAIMEFKKIGIQIDEPILMETIQSLKEKGFVSE